MIRKDWRLYADDLNTPLGQDRDRPAAKRWMGATRVLIAGAVFAGLGAAGWALYRHGPFGNASIAVVPAKTEPPTVADQPDAAPTTTGTIPTKPASEPPPGSKTITIIDGATGARKDIIVPQ